MRDARCGEGVAALGSGEDGDTRKQEEEGVVHEFDFLRGCDDAEADQVAS